MIRVGALTALLLIAGCAAKPVAPERDPALEALNRSAAQIQAAWNVIGSVKQMEAPTAGQVAGSPRARYPEAFNRRVTLTWTGDIKPLAETLAKQAGVPLVVTGTPPATPIPVYVEVNQARIGDVLRDVGFQAGERAGLTVSAIQGEESVELVYVTGKN